MEKIGIGSSVSVQVTRAIPIITTQDVLITIGFFIFCGLIVLGVYKLIFKKRRKNNEKNTVTSGFIDNTRNDTLIAGYDRNKRE